VTRGTTDAVDLGTGVRAYGRLLRHGPASRPFLFAALARLTLSMTPLGVLILVEEERGTYALAGLVSGVYAIGAALGTPLWGRLMDRSGQVRVLVPTALTSATLLVVLALATTRGAPDHVLLAIAAGVGVSYPPIGPALRSSFRIVLPDPGARRVAFALDATSVELAFVLGPLLLSALLLPGTAALPLLVTAGLLGVGGVGYCLTGVARRANAATQQAAAGHDGSTTTDGPRSAVTAAGVPVVLAVMLVISIGFGQLDTSMAGTADLALGSTERVGVLFAAIAGGSALGGLAYGARSWTLSERRAVPRLLAVFAVLLVVLAVLLATGTTQLYILLPVLFLTGLTIAPTLIMQQALLDQLVPPARLNEAQSFLSASNTAGAALGTAIAGVVIDVAGLSWSFAGAAAGVAVAAAVARFSRRGRGAGPAAPSVPVGDVRG
jgi:MFS family permease